MVEVEVLAPLLQLEKDIERLIVTPTSPQNSPKQIRNLTCKMQLSYLIFGLAAICNVVSAFHSGIALKRPFALRSAVDDKAEVTEYFNNDGFSRWNKIYSESDEVNKVQLDIRTGHQQTIDKVLNWMENENNAAKSVCDAGCGVGSLALPMSKMYKKVSASDISSSMTTEAAARAKEAKLKNLEFKVADMETLSGKYNTVTCIDVMIHYPTDKVLTGSLSGLTQRN